VLGGVAFDTPFASAFAMPMGVLPCRIFGNLELDLFGIRYRERQSRACTKQVKFCTKPRK